MTNADLRSLLCEARDTLDSEASTPEELDFVSRIDAALAGQAEGSTKDVVEWASMNMRLIEDPKLSVSHAQIEDRHLKV